MNQYSGWYLTVVPGAICPDCDEEVACSSDVGDLLDAIDEHLKDCGGME